MKCWFDFFKARGKYVGWLKFINYYKKIKSSPERLDLENNPPAKPHEEEEEKRVMCKRL